MLAVAVQYEPRRGQLDHNRTQLLFYVRAASRVEPELIVLPEMCTSGYCFPDKDTIRPFCEPRDGRSVELFRAEAQRLNTTICFGWPEIEPDSDLMYNSAAVCFADGKVEFYRKNLLFEADETWAEPGDTPYPVWVSKEGLKCSLGICMDLNDDRFIDHLRNEDIRVLAFPTNWLDQGDVVWNYWAWRMSPTNCCLVAANRYGTEDETTFRGESAILDGRVLLACTEERKNALVAAVIPGEQIAQDQG